MTTPYGPPQPGSGGPGSSGPPQYGGPQYGGPQYGGPRYGPPAGGPPPYGPPPRQAGPPPGPPRKSSAGTIIAIVVGVVVVLVLVAGFAVYKLVGGVADQVGGLADGAGPGCDAVATADVNTALGGTYEVVQLGGLASIAAPVLDARVLADAPTCWAVESGDTGGRLARVARYSGADAAARFATEKTTAMGTTQDQGNGLSVSTEGYFAGDTAAGDEAFCTSGDFLGSAGALVRRGDTLIYVSTTAAGDGAEAAPQIGIDESGNIAFATDKANCEKAVALAAEVR